MSLEPKIADRKTSYDDEVSNDARAAYDEVMGRIKSGRDSGDSEPAIAEEKGGEGTASRTPEKIEKRDSKPEGRDDGRDEHGRFKARDGGDEKPAAGADKAAPGAPQGERKPDPQAEPAAGAQPVAGGPPTSFSVKTKAEWDKLPEHVRADIVKREGEMQQGLAALRDYRDLKPYAELAQQNNTTIKDYIDRTLRIERLIKQDVGAGLAFIAQNSGLNQHQAAQLFAQLAMKFGGHQVAANPQAGGHPNGQAADPLAEALRPILGPMLNPLLQQVEQLKGSLSQRELADRNAHAQSLAKAEAEFRADPANRYVAELEPTMVQLFEKGMVPLTGNHIADMKTAYDMAARMHPEVAEALIEQRLQTKAEAQRKAEQEAAEKAKAASRSLSGSRVPGSRYVEKEEDAPSKDDVEADVIRAYRAVKRA